MGVRFCLCGHSDASHDEAGCHVPDFAHGNRVECWCRLDRETVRKGEDYYDRVAAAVSRAARASGLPDGRTRRRSRNSYSLT